MPSRNTPETNHHLGSQNTSSTPTILGIWRVGESVHIGPDAQNSLAQPADAIGSPRWDYVLRCPTEGSSNESRRQIKNFANCAAEVNHPNLVAVLDASDSADCPYLVMPRLDGPTMSEMLKRGPRKPLPVSLWLVRQVAQALEALHKRNWVHGDVTPSNMIVGAAGHVTLIDLGFASRRHTLSKQVFRGTPEYAAPETLSGETAALSSADVFSLGRILWQWLTHVESTSDLHLSSVAELVESMIAENPEERPTAGDLAKRLLRLEIETLGSHFGPALRPRKAA